jgi:hypothetical protein
LNSNLAAKFVLKLNINLELTSGMNLIMDVFCVLSYFFLSFLQTLFLFLFSFKFQIQGFNSNSSFYGTFIFTLNVQFEHSLNFYKFLFCILEYFSLSYFQIRI